MGLKMCCFASGSKGNCSYVSDGETNILIDMGISATRAEGYLSVLGVDPDCVNVFVTHSHTDHIGGLKVFCKKHPHAAVHCRRESAGEIYRISGVTPIVDEARAVSVGGLTVTAMPVPHDVPCFGYIVRSGERRVAVVTDIGAVDEPVIDELGRCNIVMLESNHDIEMLRRNPTYSQALKARIASRYGHLSNVDCAAACAMLASRGVNNFILAHLSEENNTQDLALSVVNGALGAVGRTGLRVVAASQNKPTGLFEVC